MRGGRAGGLRALRAALLLGILTALPAAAPAAAARLVALKGSEARAGEGAAPAPYGRIRLTFDKPVSVKARASAGVLVLSFSERAPGGAERLAQEMPAYISVARRDPDGTGLRLALQRPVRVSVQEAAEQVFVDLLPENWTGLVPPLPAEVVAELARRAEAAEAALRVRNPSPVRRPLALEIAHLPTLTRLSLRLPPGVHSESLREGGATRLRIAGAWTIDVREARGRTAPALAGLSAETDPDSASLLLTPAEGYALSVERDEDAVSVDLVKAGERPAVPAVASAPGTQAVAQAGDQAPEAPRRAESQRPAASREAAPRESVREVARPVQPEAEPPLGKPGAGLVFGFRTLPPVAMFERLGVATLAFETDETLRPPETGAGGLQPLGEPRRVGKLTVLRFAVPPGRLVDLLPVAVGEGAGWELAAGETLTPSAVLTPRRLSDAAGRFGLAVDLPRPSAATWLDLDGERIAVVTTQARRPAGMPKRQRFVDFELLPSRFGLAVLAYADDLAVRPDLDGVAVGREGGLAVSSVARRPEAALAEAGAPAIDPEIWARGKSGNLRTILRQQFAAATAAPPGERGPLRVTHARTLIAAGLDLEGLTALDVAAADDPLVAAQRETTIWRGLALLRAGRLTEARAVLGGEVLDRDAEVVLWRSVAEAGQGAWRSAETGFGRTLGLAGRLPEDLRDLVLAAAAESAIENGDIDAAVARMEAAPKRDPLARDRLALVKGRVEELTGQTVAALDRYERLEVAAAPPVAAAATLRRTLLALATSKMSSGEALARLERLAVTWRGGPTEEAIIAGLARSYAVAGRFREAFATTRRAAAAFPASETARVLNAEAQGLFDGLYLGGRGDALPGIEAVALYFDFKEFAPIGRRGDEVVRRLADRLVGLDLLDSAGDLLQHQIDHRLTGQARAAVAARLATVRLMDGKPLQALEAIDATHLPELPTDLARARALVRARALSDLSRTDLALETIEDESGPDVSRLRADILWAARRWRGAGEAHEALLGEVWRGKKTLDEAARADVIRAGIAYDLADERLGLERLKAKFSGLMAESADARSFALITGADPTRQPGFREIAQRASKAETLGAFLAEYRKRYPETAAPERGKSPGAPAGGRGEGAQSQAETPPTPPPG
ncbi:hypothetical protein [Methylobacterium radiodurans]|uniref:hypothetical protein n=1 Tax=Methylobacterium radiodurans TaxID=2202828 RepID=UPI00194E2ADC